MRRIRRIPRPRLFGLTPLLFLLVVPVQGICLQRAVAQGETKPPTQESPPQSGAQKPGKQGPAKSETTGEAQGDITAGRDFPGATPPDGIGFSRRGLLDKNGRPLGPEAIRQMNAAQRAVAARARNGLPRTEGPHPGSHLFKPTAYLRPRRLAPGEAGTLRVIVALTAGNVVLPGSTAQLMLDPANGQLILGTPVLAPPAEGTLQTKYKGQVVYEDTLDFNVPITVRTEAKAGSYPVRGSVQLSLHDGNSALPRGLFTADVQGTIKIGAPLPKVVVPRSALQTSADRSPTTTTNSAPQAALQATKTGSASTSPSGSETGRIEPLPGSEERIVTDDGSAFALSSQDDSLLLWALGGTIGVLLILILIFRRR